MKEILDMCCGSKKFYFDKADARVVYCDIRKETIEVADKSSTGGKRTLIISPDLQCNFTALPFADGEFKVVVFDPPHLVNVGEKSWLASSYGRLQGDWREDIRKGFAEGFRVLTDGGVLIFKWNELDIPVKEITKLTPYVPVIGQRSGKAAKTHWIIYIK